jgi:hypothetical protein
MQGFFAESSGVYSRSVGSRRCQLCSVWDTVRDTDGMISPSSRCPAYDQAMGNKPRRANWTDDEVKREQAAERARVRRDAARGVSKNLENAVAHTEFAQRFAEAFKPSRRR